jgi:hypothetical protein
MRRSRVPSNEPGKLFAALFSAGCATNMSAFDFRQAQVNYDLPWNSQRIEQRIGRCHRYGQRYDVVVVNFLNKNNAADQRVHQLLAEKFKLFSGVFGASDEVLGAIESGAELEKRIVRFIRSAVQPRISNLNSNACAWRWTPSLKTPAARSCFNLRSAYVAKRVSLPPRLIPDAPEFVAKSP